MAAEAHARTDPAPALKTPKNKTRQTGQKKNRQTEKLKPPAHRKKKKAARPIIPGKNPKTQRDVQSNRLVLRRAKKTTGTTLRQDR